MARTRKKALYVATESTYSTTYTTSSDGSSFVWIPALSVGEVSDDKELLPTAYQTNRMAPTRPVVGRDGWSLSFQSPLVGMATAAGDGTPASNVADDWLDKLLLHTFGTQATTTGEGVGIGSSTNTLVLDADANNVEDLIPVWEASIPSAAAPRTQWVQVTSDSANGNYATYPNWVTNPTTAAVAYGVKGYYFSDAGGSATAFVLVEDDVKYLLTGGRCTGLTLECTAGQMWIANWTFSGDTKTSGGSFSSLPATGVGTVNTPLRGMLSPVWFNDTLYSTKSVKVDFGIGSQVIEGTGATNGRAGYELTSRAPSITIEPQRTSAIEDFKRTPTTGRTLVQIGKGQLDTVLNTMCVAFGGGTATEISRVDDGGVLRLSLKIEAFDSSATIASKKLCLLARA